MRFGLLQYPRRRITFRIRHMKKWLKAEMLGGIGNKLKLAVLKTGGHAVVETAANFNVA